MREPAQIVRGLVGGDYLVGRILGEASVHRPNRGRIYVAYYTGLGGPCSKKYGHGRSRRRYRHCPGIRSRRPCPKSPFGGAGQPQRGRNRQSPGGAGGGLTQREVAQLLHISERGVRAIERRALRKLAQHPQLRALWRQYLAGELTEQVQRLSAPEIQALLGLTRSHAERQTLLKVLALIQN